MRPYINRQADNYARPLTGAWRERAYPPESTTDWIGLNRAASITWGALRPFHGEEIHSMTPELHWPDLDRGATSHSYTVQIQDIFGNTLRTYVTQAGDNYLGVPFVDALPSATEYQWIVKSNINNVWSSPRRFYVRADAWAYDINVPGTAPTLGERVYDKIVGANGQTAIAHPRYISKDQNVINSMIGALHRDDLRNPGVKYLETNLPWIRNQTTNETGFMSNYFLGIMYDRLYNSLMYWKMVGNTTLGLQARDLAKKITVDLSTYWTGTVGMKRGYGTVSSVDQSNSRTDYPEWNQDCRMFILILALGYDAFYPGNGTGTDLTTAQAARILEYLDIRFEQMRVGLIANRRVNLNQYDSHAVNDMAQLICSAMLIAQADMSSFPTTYNLAANVEYIIKRVVPLWVTLMPMFRNEDGSTHRSTPYDEGDSYNNASLLFLHMFGIDLLKKPKIANAPTWRGYMYGIPGSRARGQFGDGSGEDAPGISSYGALVFRNPNPFNSDMYQKFDGETIFGSLITWIPQVVAVQPKPVKHNLMSNVFPSGGYYASLANYQDPLGSAVYMRSSQYGGYNHAHHDMNHFVFVVKGKHILADTGYYKIVGYGPPHFLNWARHSRAHNTLSLDGGLGHQSSNNGNANIDRWANGKMVAWGEQGEYSYALAEAATSYQDPGYTLDTFQRLLVHFRDDVVICIDYVKSNSGNHSFDWNFHTEKALTFDSGTGVYTLTDGPAVAYLKNEYNSLGVLTPTPWVSGARTAGQYNYSGWDGPLGLTGTVTSGTMTTLTDNTKNWTPNQWKDYFLTVNNVDCVISSNTATTLTFAAEDSNDPIVATAAGTYKIADLWAPGPPKPFIGKEQYHHRISSASTGLEWKSVTTICGNTANQLTNTGTSELGNTIVFTFTFKSKVRTVTLDYVNKTVTVN